MNLYEKNKNGSISVYKFDEVDGEVYNYIEEQLSTIPENERFFIAKEYFRSVGRRLYFEKNMRYFDSRIFDMDDLNSISATKYMRSFGVDSSLHSVHRTTLLHEYNCHMFIGNPMMHVNDNGTDRYFLFTKENYRPEFDGSRIRVIDGIIQLPESLYLLELIRSQKFSLIQDKDVSKQLSFYSLEYCGTHSNDALVWNMIGHEAILEKAENDKPLLKILRNQR